MPGRTSRHDLDALARDDLAGLRDVLGPTWDAHVHARAVVGEAQARQLVERAGRGRHVVVADKISEPARQLLEGAGWSWVDRRIGGRFADGRREIVVRYRGGDRRVAAASDGPIRGRAGIAYAAALLCRPSAPPSLRQVASIVGMSPQSMSNAARQLAEAGLVGPDRMPTLPDLFWAVAEVWAGRDVTPVRQVPTPADGWVLGGDAAAAALGAPVVSLGDRPSLWLPSPVDVRRAARRFEPCPWDERAAVLAVAPTPLLTAWATPARPWALPHPVFAALDLAGDAGRGREILARWEPEGIDIVWR